MLAAASIPSPFSLTGTRPVPPASTTRDATPPGVVELTRRLAAGDEAAFREFHARYFDRLHHFLLAVTRGDEHSAHDALQETLLRVARHARAFDDEDIFWGWLKAVARNAARDGGRQRRRYRALLEKFSLFRPTPAPAPAAIEDNRLRALLDETLAGLDEADSRLITGKYLRGDTVAELAEQTGLTPKAVESRLLRLRRSLGETLLQKLRTP
ncbi:MAG: sigma-70 family RNA polymerase sigma factor [Verrucomicrobiota bacterium]